MKTPANTVVQFTGLSVYYFDFVTKMEQTLVVAIGDCVLGTLDPRDWVENMRALMTVLPGRIESI